MAGLVEAVVLINTQAWMRVAAVGLDDVVELRRCGLNWIDESNEPIQFGFLLAREHGVMQATRLLQTAAASACQ
jgi:hypothetical protein